MLELERRKKLISYDNGNIFAKILRKEIPCKKIYEDEFVLSFYDINPLKKVHALSFQRENILILMILS